jgi:hypothetical protein
MCDYEDCDCYGDGCQYHDDEEDYDFDAFYDGGEDFEDPNGNSALRRATASNPRNLPCPTCGEPDRLTPKDKALGYQCDECADRLERGY